MSISQHAENPVHRSLVNASEMVRQNDVAAALNPPFAGYDPHPPVITGAAGVKAADIAHARRCLASAIANSASPVPYITALRELGTGGV